MRLRFFLLNFTVQIALQKNKDSEQQWLYLGPPIVVASAIAMQRELEGMLAEKIELSVVVVQINYVHK